MPPNVGDVVMYGYTGEMKQIGVSKTEEEMRKMSVKQLREKAMMNFPGFQGKRVGMHIDGKTMSDDKPLSEYGLRCNSVIHLTLIVTGG